MVANSAFRILDSGFQIPMPSNPGQNLHLVSSQIHAVASSSHLANSSSQLVVLSSYLVESSSHLVVSSILLTSPLLVYSSVILQLVVSPFNSSCRTSTRRSLYPYILACHLTVVWTRGLSLLVQPSGPRDENKKMSVSHIFIISLWLFFLIICTIIGVSGSFEALIEF